MYNAVYALFSQYEDLKQYLLEIGDTKLIEANPYDEYWGVGLAFKATDELKHNNNLWKGLNKLRNILRNIIKDVRVALKIPDLLNNVILYMFQ